MPDGATGGNAAQFVVLIGASGAGKTTIAGEMAKRYADDTEVFYFDRIGVPAVEQMIVEYGSGEGWQRAKTIEWMAKLAALTRSGRRLLFEGQTALASSQGEPRPLAGASTCLSLSTAMMKRDRGVSRSIENNQSSPAKR